MTSRRYNLGIDYGTYRDTASREEYLRWTFDWCREVKRLLKMNGSVPEDRAPLREEKIKTPRIEPKRHAHASDSREVLRCSSISHLKDREQEKASIQQVQGGEFHGGNEVQSRGGTAKRAIPLTKEKP